MKVVMILTATALAAASFLVLADSGAKGGPGHMAERLKAADTNGDGMISRAEAAALPMIAKHFDEIDTDGNGQLSPDELRAFHEKMRAQHEQTQEQRFAEHFRKIDTDGDGRISLAEAQANAPRLAEHFSQIDTNGDGFITPEEMKAAHQHHGRGK